MGSCFLKVFIFVCVFGFLLVEAVEIVGRWSLDDLDGGQLLESLSQNKSSTLLVAREGATNTRTGLLNVEDVNYLNFAVPNGECVVDSTKCGNGIGVSFWMRYKGFISDIVKERYGKISELEGWLASFVDSDLRWINCLRASEQGWAASTFHSRCDYKGPTLTIVQVKKKFVFGGFTDQDWGGSTGFKKSDKSFLFTLINEDGKPAANLSIQNHNRAIYNSPSHGPRFGDTDLVISDMAAENLDSKSNPGSDYQLPSGVTSGSADAVNLLAGSEYFVPENMEVFHLECFNPLGMQNGEIPDDKISLDQGLTIDAINDPRQARLNNPSGSIWSPQNAQVAKMVVDLVSKRRILGIDAHGNKEQSDPRYPTDFQVQYWDSSGSSWTTAQSALSLDDESSIKRFMFLPSFTTSKLKVILNTCPSNKCALAMEIFGCAAETCDQALHMESITASSSSSGFEPANVRFDGNKCWKPSNQNDPSDYLEVDLGRVRILTGLATHGFNSEYVNLYKLQYSTDNVKWNNYLDLSGSTKLFQVSQSSLTEVTLQPVVQARFIRLFPVSGMCLKLALYGCTAFKGEYSGILSSGSEPVDGTGLLIYYFSGALRGEYRAIDEHSQSRGQQQPGTGWTRVTFIRKDNGDPHLLLDDVVVSQDDHNPDTFALNSDVVINLASTMSSQSSWSVENIQLSDLSLWIDIPNDHDGWAEGELPGVLDKCNFDDSPCSWKIGNWTRGAGCVPSNSFGTGPCAGASGDGFIYLGSSYPRSKGDSVTFESPYLVSAYRCVSFQYHMWGKDIGRLDVAIAFKGEEKARKLKWRLSGDQGDSWQEGKIQVQQNEGFKVVFEAVVGDGFLGDIAIDEVTLSTTDCTLFPSYALPDAYDTMPATGCSLGMESGEILDIQISASSENDGNHAAIQGRLQFQAEVGKAGSWSSAINDANQWLQIDLGVSGFKVTHVATQGRNGYPQWVTTYKLQFGNDGATFKYYKETGQSVQKVFAGNTDMDTVVHHALNPPIRARYIRFRPETWNNHISMRVELYLCPGIKKSAIIGHLPAPASFLVNALNDNGQSDRIWVPCYRAVTYGRDASVFHSRCAGKGPTVTIVRSDNYVFGGYTDADWGSSLANGASVSHTAFLFSLNNKEGTEKIFNLKPEKRYKAHFVNQNHGPTFGEDDLVLDSMSTGFCSLGNSFDSSADAGFEFTEANNFAVSDVEVLYIGENLCHDQCSHAEGRCDDVTGKCICDWSERNVEWCIEGEPRKILNLYQDAASYWPLDSTEDLKDHKRLGWGKAHGGVILEDKGLSGHALQLDGETGWVDLGSLDTACPGGACSDDFSISLWFKYHLKGNDEEQTFFTFDNGMTELEIAYKSAPFYRVVVTLNTSSLSAWYGIGVTAELWNYLGVSWNSAEQSLTIQNNDNIWPTTIMWYVCHACERPISSNTSVSLGAGSFPNVSYDEIGIWLQPFERQRFIDIYETYKGPSRLYAEMSLQFTNISWGEEYNDPESDDREMLLQVLTDEISQFYSSLSDVGVGPENISLSDCWNNGGLVSCNLTLYYYSSGYAQLGFLLRDWVPHANLLNASGVVLLGSRNTNVPSTPVPGLTAHATGPTLVKVWWNSPNEKDIPGIFTGYAVYYKEVSSDSDYWYPWEIRNTSTLYYLSNLKPYTNYTVNVTVLSLEGEGRPATLYVRTEEGAPPRPPVNVTVSNITSTIIHVEWNGTEGSIPGVLRGYHIFYTKAEDIINETIYTTIDNITITNYVVNESRLLNETIYDVGLFQYNITGLEAYTQYCLWVTAFTVTDSPNSEAVCFLTDEDVPGQAPVVAEINPVSSKECKFSWVPIPPEHHKGILLGYRIVYYANGSVENSNFTVDASTNRRIPVDNLRPYTFYFLKVAGFTSKGEGNYSDPVGCQTYEDVPSRPPTDIRVNNVSITKTSCELNWGPVPAEHHNGIIIGYELMYGMSSQPALQQSFNLSVDTYSYVLTGLDIYTEYNLSIVGRTSAGAGIHNEKSAVTCLTEADYPSASPTSLSILATTSESCQISWTAIPVTDINGELTSYEVVVVKNDTVDEGLDDKLNHKLFVCGGLSSINISMLEAFTLYNVIAAVNNHIGKGNYSETLQCITGEAAPSLPPQNIRGHNTSSQSIMVMWDPVPESNRHGIVREYLVHMRPAASSWPEVTGTSGNLSKEIGGLQPYTNYSIRVAAKTIALGNFSEPIFVVTGEAAPFTAPQIVQSYNTSGRSIFVQWAPPVGPIPGILRGYRIFYNNLNISGSPTYNETVDASTLSYEITLLEVYSRYEITVLAFTVADGPQSSPEIMYTANKVLPPPDGVPDDLALGDKTSTSCELMWKEVVNSHPDPDGAVKGYYVYYRMTGLNDSLDKLDVVGANTTSYIVENLKKFTEYEFQIVAYNQYDEGNASEIFSCQTEEDVPSTPPVNLTSVEVTPRGIKLKWDLPPKEYWNGIIRGFIIMYYRKDEGNASARYVNVPVNSGGSKRKKRALEPADLERSLTGLDEYTLYVLRVLAYTIGNSDYSPAIEIRTAEDAPSSPPTEIVVEHNGSSTSLLVTWSEVPFADQNGVIRGFIIGYWVKDDPGTTTYVNVTESSVSVARRKKRAAVASYMHQLTGLRIWTKYYVTVAAYTVSQGPPSMPYLVRTDEGVPCMPPQYVTYDVPGLSVLLAKWNPVPVHCHNGIILGYRVKYQRLDGSSPCRIENTTADVLYAFLYDMDLYANYSISISAFTRKGDGNATLDLAMPDSLGPKSTPINVTAQNHTTTSSITVSWRPIEDEFILERMLGYRVSYRAVMIGDEKVEKEQPTYNFTVRKATLQAVIEGLESYVLYQINVSGFTRRGDGPSGITGGETCRCHKRLTTNYRLFPPYVDQLEVTGDEHFTVANMTGMLPAILDDLVVTCCGTCSAHGMSYVDFKYNGTNGTAKQNSEKEMKALIDDRNDLSFPVYGWTWQEYYGAYYRYIPLVESPGVAFIVIEDDVLSPSERLIKEVFATWPYIVVTTLLAVLAGIIIWFLDTNSNPDHFPHSFCCGAGNGFWWAFISMTTLGYGDKVPSANVSKLFAIVWILIGLVIMGILSGALTSAITVFVIKDAITLYGAKVAAIQDTPEFRLAVARSARVNEVQNYTNFAEVYDGLIREEVQGMLIDTYEAGSKRDRFKDPRIHVRTIFDYKSTYGVVLAGSSTKLMQCSRSYMRAHQDEMYEHIGKFISSIQEEHVPESEEVTSGLFDPNNGLFRYFTYTCSALVGMAVMLGLIYEYRRKVQAREAARIEDKSCAVKTNELLQEMKNLVAEFHCTFKRNYYSLSKKHKCQLKNLKNQLHVEKPDANSCSNSRNGFFNETYDKVIMSPVERHFGDHNDRHGTMLH